MVAKLLFLADLDTVVDQMLMGAVICGLLPLARSEIHPIFIVAFSTGIRIVTEGHD